MATAKRTLYDILGIEPDANPIDIGLAYERRSAELAAAVPPDAAESAMVRQAYEVLSDPKRRETYDASLVTAGEKAAAAAQAEAPDLLLEPEPVRAKRVPVWAGIGAGIVLLAAAILFTMRSPSPPAPPAADAKPVAAPPAPPPEPKPLAPAEIMASASPAVGIVLNYAITGVASPVGLAVAVDRGSFVTTCHGIPPNAQLVVRVSGTSHSASLAVSDDKLDLCKLAVADIAVGGLPVSEREPRAGDRVFALGANAKGDLALTEGTIKQVRPVPEGKVLELSVPIAPTGSGGAVFDAYGRIAGIATTPHTFGAGLNIALPASSIAQLRAR